MSRAARAQKRNGIVEQYAEAFRKEFKRDIGFDLRSRIDRESDPLKRGAMLAAERIVYAEMRGK